MSEPREVIEVTVRDLDAGGLETVRLTDGPEGFLLICGPGCYLSHEQAYSSGTVQLTIKPRDGR